jgi:hypothetical protein
MIIHIEETLCGNTNIVTLRVIFQERHAATTRVIIQVIPARLTHT